MKIELEIAQYSPECGIWLNWIDGSIIESRIESNTVLIKANREGLISLAQHLLTLAQEGVNPGNHIHLDQYNSLENNSCEIIIGKK